MKPLGNEKFSGVFVYVNGKRKIKKVLTINERCVKIEM